MNKAFLIILVTFLVIASVTAVPMEKVLRYGELGKPRYWWPYFDDSPIAIRTMDLYFETLVEDYSQAQKIYADPPMISTRLVSNDIKIDFERNPQMVLRMSDRDYKWSNGIDISPEDVRFTLMDILGDKSHSTIFNYIADTVYEVSYNRDNLYINFYFPSKYMLSSLEVYVIPAAFSTAYNYWTYAKNKSIGELRRWCSGPYIPVKEEDTLVAFEANPNYPLSLNIDRVEMLIRRDAKTLADMFIQSQPGKKLENSKDRLDIIFEIPMAGEDKVKQILNIPTVRTLPSLENRFYYITLNYKKDEIFRDEKFRRLLIRSIDRKTILQNVFLGEGQLITGPFLPTFQWIDSSIKPWEYDRTGKSQKELYENYGNELAGKTWKFIIPRGREDVAKIAYTIASNLVDDTGLGEIGFKISIVSLKTEDYYEALRKGDFDIAFTEYAAMKTFVSLKPLLSENGSQNFGGFNSVSTLSYDKELSELLNKVEGVEAFKLDDLEREKIYKKIHRFAHEKEYYLWLFSIQRQTFMYKHVIAPYLDPSRPFKNIDKWDIKY